MENGEITSQKEQDTSDAKFCVRQRFALLEILSTFHFTFSRLQVFNWKVDTLEAYATLILSTGK